MAQDPIAQLESVVAELRARGPGVAKVSFRDRARSKSHARFVDWVRELERYGFSRNAIAREIEVDPTTLFGWVSEGDRRREQIPAWAKDAVEELLQSARFSPRSGTDG